MCIIQMLFRIIIHPIQVLVVAGGMTADGYTASTEIFEDGEWREVGELPMAMAELRGVTLEDTVIMTGGRS